MTYLVKPPSENIRVSVTLPASKSISNRVLIIRALCGADFRIDNLSDCDDTRVMLQGLQDMPETIDVGAAGTSMRFLTAYLAQLAGTEHVITGSKRMKKRPIRILVEALRTLGADIEYLGEEGFPPLRIRGRKLAADRVLHIDGSVSSQYISAILMIAPLLENGLSLYLDGEISSRPYIDMTVRLMNHFGAKAGWAENAPVIQVLPQDYHYDRDSFTVEPDWSAAAFWLEIIALRGGVWHDEVRLPGLVTDSLQGDAEARWIFDNLNCFYASLYSAAFYHKSPREGGSLQLDFSACPDLAQAAVVTACLGNIPFVFTGLESLHIKETDRILALKKELRKLGCVLHGGEEDGEGLLMWQRGICRKQKQPVIATYQDHRMAMAFAPACIRFGEIRIADPEVVSKSYPHFWEDLRLAGFTVEEVQE